MLLFAVLEHSEIFSVRWHKFSDKRYWERFLPCGQPAEPGICLAAEFWSWQRINRCGIWIEDILLPKRANFTAKELRRSNHEEIHQRQLENRHV